MRIRNQPCFFILPVEGINEIISLAFYLWPNDRQYEQTRWAVTEHSPEQKVTAAKSGNS